MEGDDIPLVATSGSTFADAERNEPVGSFAKRRMVVQLGWSLREGERVLPQIYVCPTPPYSLIMNIVIWNSKGALKPNFQSHVRELNQAHNLAIMVIMKTHLGGPRDKEITDRLPFDGAIHTETIGHTGGLWLLWNLDRVEITPLVNTEQEIHVVVKVRP